MLLISEGSISEQTGTSMDNTDEITELPSACDQSPKTEDVLDLTKEPAKEDVSEEQGSTFPSHSQIETEVWSLIQFECYFMKYNQSRIFIYAKD